MYRCPLTSVHRPAKKLPLNVHAQYPDLRSLINRLILYILLFYLQYPPAEYRCTCNWCCKNRWSFMPIPESCGIFSEIHSPVTRLEITYVMALTLQPIRCFLSCSGETGTRLTTAIHRRLSPRFFLRGVGRLYAG